MWVTSVLPPLFFFSDSDLHFRCGGRSAGTKLIILRLYLKVGPCQANLLGLDNRPAEASGIYRILKVGGRPEAYVE